MTNLGLSCRETKTKAISLTNYNEHKWEDEPIRTWTIPKQIHVNGVKGGKTGART